MASKSKQTKVGSLEVRISKNGTRYLVGTILGKDYVAFKSKAEFMKEHPKAPNISGFVDKEYGEDEKKEYLLALWNHTSKNGEKYLSGSVGDMNVVAFYDAKKELYNVFKQTEQPKADIKNEELPF